MQKAILFIAVITVSLMQVAYAQGTSPFSKPITAGDSVLLKRYLDTVNTALVFSQKRQHYYDSALTIKPWKASWWQQKAIPLYKQQKYEAGAPYLDSAVKYDALRYIDYRAFMKCIFQKSYRESIKDFRMAKAIIGAGEVMDHTYDFYIGLCYLQLNQFDSSEYYLVKSTSEQNKSMGAHWVHPLDWFYLGIVYYEKEDYPKAIEIFDKALKLYTNFSDAKYYKAVCLERSDKHDAASDLFKEAALDFNAGYTINEDNVDHEAYPYQVNKHYFK